MLQYTYVYAFLMYLCAFHIDLYACFAAFIFVSKLTNIINTIGSRRCHVTEADREWSGLWGADDPQEVRILLFPSAGTVELR